MACKRHKPPPKPKPKPKPDLSPKTSPAKPAGPETQMKDNSVVSGGGVARNNSGKKKKSNHEEKKLNSVANASDGGSNGDNLGKKKKLIVAANDGGVAPNNSGKKKKVSGVGEKILVAVANKLKIGEKKLNSVAYDCDSKRRRKKKSGSSVGEKKAISKESDGEVNRSVLKREESSVGEKQLKSVSNEGKVTGNNLKKIRVGGKKLISGKNNDGGKCSVGVKNTTSKLNGGGNDTTGRTKNRRSRRGKKKEKSSVCEATNVGVNIVNVKANGVKKNSNDQQKSDAVSRKDSSLIAKVDGGKKNSNDQQKSDAVSRKVSSLIAKVDGGKKNRNGELKIDKICKKDSSLIAKVDGGKNYKNGEQKIGNVGKKKSSLIVEGGNKNRNASGRIRVGTLKTVGRVGKKVNLKVREGSGKKQPNKNRIGRRKPLSQAKKKGGMKCNLNDFGLWDENEKMLREALRRIGEGKRVAMKKAYLKAYMLRLDVMQAAAQKALDGLKAGNDEVKVCGEDCPNFVEENPCCFDWKNQVLGMIARRIRLRDELQADISWCPPKIGVLKWNTDASFREDSGMAAIGGVLRDWNGSLRCVFSCPIECCDSNEAELRAIYKALELASKDWLLSLQVIIESDSMNAVTWCNDDKGGPVSYGYMLNFIRECRLWWPGLQITYMGRKSNSVADRLAKQAHQRTADFIQWV